MNAEKQKPSLNTLDTENYSAEQQLSDQSRKITQKMFRYISTFPLSEYEVELIRKDILGMAAEAEARNESLESVIGKPVKEFCNELIYAVGNISVPRGYRFLRVSGWFFQIVGWIYRIEFFMLVYALAFVLMEIADYGTGKVSVLFDSMAQTYGNGNIARAFYSILLVCGASLLLPAAGKRAKKYAGDVSKASGTLKWGIALVLFFTLDIILQSILVVTTSSGAYAESYSAATLVILSLSSVPSYIFPLLYIIGAYMNKKEA